MWLILKSQVKHFPVICILCYLTEGWNKQLGDAARGDGVQGKAGTTQNL